MGCCICIISEGISSQIIEIIESDEKAKESSTKNEESIHDLETARRSARKNEHKPSEINVVALNLPDISNEPSIDSWKHNCFSDEDQKGLEKLLEEF